mgnify:CR=1 FL=1
MKPSYQKTMYACFVAYIVQAVVNCFAPLLFVTFQNQYSIPLAQITALITINFAVQLAVDLLSTGFVDRIGYRAAALLAHGCAAVGLVGLAFLPDLLPDPFLGLLAAVCIYATGGGLIEVLVSPIIEACPTDNKETAMSLLHSFYCWGHVGVVLLSTAFFTLFGVDNWKVMALLWALIPLGNLIAFLRVPIAPLLAEGEKGMSLRQLCGKPLFWVLLLLMVCAGASEQAVSQWAATFAEKGLGVSKTLGDLMGPMLFAILMGTARAFYGKYGDRMRLQPFMVGSTLLCVGAYLLIGLTGQAWLGLVGCGLCGLSVGIMWPGAFSMAAKFLRGGGTALFALLALAGDLGCSAGPSLVGFVSGALGDELRLGILAGTVFPLLLLAGLFACQRIMAKKV